MARRTLKRLTVFVTEDERREIWDAIDRGEAIDVPTLLHQRLYPEHGEMQVGTVDDPNVIMAIKMAQLQNQIATLTTMVTELDSVSKKPLKVEQRENGQQLSNGFSH